MLRILEFKREKLRPTGMLCYANQHKSRMVMKIFGVFFALFALSACSHTIKFRASHFAIPITSEKQWGGQVAISGSSVTKVSLVNDYTTNPPTRTDVGINRDSDLDVDETFFAGAFSAVGLDANLSILNSLDLYSESSLIGLRWQFLNHGSTSETVVAAIQAGVASREESESITSGGNTSTAKSKIRTNQLGISVGYQYANVVPYISYVREKHEVTTDITNTGGNFEYKDEGTHQYLAVGLTKRLKALTYAIEYTRVLAKWERSEEKSQGALAARIGIAW